MFKSKKAISPVIASVILIAITIILAATIFSFSKSSLESFASPVDCQGISFQAGIVEDSLADSEKILEIDNQGKDLAGAIIKVHDSATDSIGNFRVEEEVIQGLAKQITVIIPLTPAEGTDSNFDAYDFLIAPLIKKDDKIVQCSEDFEVPAQIQVIRLNAPAPSGGEEEPPKE